MGPTAALLPCGTRLHLQHGPIDLIIGADGAREIAFDAAVTRFQTMLAELVAELPFLRQELSSQSKPPMGKVAQRMHFAAMPFCNTAFLTRMSAVAGAVADEVLQAMVDASELDRAYVNNGGDIALHLSEGAEFTTSMRSHTGQELGRIRISHHDPVRGIATSGRHGRSLSLGIADSVTVLAANAARADAAATLIANAVDLPDHPAVERCPADAIDDASDLGTRPVVVSCAPLSAPECAAALNAGLARATQFRSLDLIAAAGMFLQGQATTTPSHMLPTPILEPLHA